MATNWKLGRECRLSIGGSQLRLVKEVTVELGGREADITTRDSQGIKRVVVALEGLTNSGTADYSSGDVGVQAPISADTGTTAAPWPERAEAKFRWPLALGRESSR